MENAAMPYIEGFVLRCMANMEMPFDAKRMFWCGFEQIVNE
jgi:hypothetical protein